MKMSKIVMSIALLFVLLYLCSCATIFSGTTQMVSINSNVQGATVWLNGQPIGQTPFMGSIKKNQTNMRVTMEGYQDSNVYLTSSFAAFPFLLNFITGGLPGTTTDFATGSVYEYSPSTYYVEMRAGNTSQNDYMEQYEIRRYAMLNLSQIALDSNEENGEYLLALSDMMSSKMDREQAVASIKDALAISKGDQLLFGDELIKTFQQY